jgi:hypothetical protein
MFVECPLDDARVFSAGIGMDESLSSGGERAFSRQIEARGTKLKPVDPISLLLVYISILFFFIHLFIKAPESLPYPGFTPSLYAEC